MPRSAEESSMADRRPNLLVIMSDEHDPRVSQPYGHPFVRTPNVQRLAERGVVFENGTATRRSASPRGPRS
jgi:choline-sulfatase